MPQTLNDRLNSIEGSLSFLVPELILTIAFLALLVMGFMSVRRLVLLSFAATSFAVNALLMAISGLEIHASLFSGTLSVDGLSSYLKILINAAGVLTCLLSIRAKKENASEYYVMITAVALGGHILVMSNNFLMIFLSLELISLASYVLAGFSFDKKSSEGSLKYFLFGATASAVMLYGFSFLYGFTGTLDLHDEQFFTGLAGNTSPLVLIAGFMVLSGFLYKITAAPMHPWAPDVYEAAPVPVIAFFSVAPKLAGLGVLIKFILSIHLFGESSRDWQLVLAAVSILTITVGNFSALLQSNAKRMMAYSSIAHSGFLLVGIVSFSPQGIHFMLFYATVYLIMNFLVFHYLGSFEEKGVMTMKEFSGKGRSFPLSMVLMLVGLISLTGLPPTAGFTAKLLIFSGLWDSYQVSGKTILLWLLVFGLVNTVISLFYYLRIPWLAFLRSGDNVPAPDASGERHGMGTWETLFGLILVLVLLGLFFVPGLLMGWINKINFVP